MPCRDYTDSEVISDQSEEIRKLRAMLCGVLTVLENHGALPMVLASYDGKKSGVGVHVVREWWENHKKEDKRRLNEEQAEIERQKAVRRRQYEKLKAEFEGG